jgi:hypothetical protein
MIGEVDLAPSEDCQRFSTSSTLDTGLPLLTLKTHRFTARRFGTSVALQIILGTVVAEFRYLGGIRGNPIRLRPNPGARSGKRFLSEKKGS